MSGHAVDPFLDAWAERGGRDGADLRLRAARAVSLADPDDLDAVRETLRAVLARDADDRDRFDALFPHFFRRSLGAPDEGPRAATPAPAPTKPVVYGAPLPPPAEPWWASVPFRLALVAAAAALVVVALWRAPSPAPSSSADAAVPGDAALPPTPAAVHAEAPPPPAAPPARIPWVAIAFTLAATVALAEALTAWRRLHPRALPPLPEAPSFRDATVAEAEPDWRSPRPSQPWTPQELDALVAAAGIARTPDLHALDLPRTVDASCQRLGLLTPVYRARPTSDELTVVTPRTLDAVAEALVGSLVEGLRARGVAVARTSGMPEARVYDLVLVFVDARRPYDPPVAAWAQRPHVALVEARDPWRWGPELASLPCAVDAPTPAGIGDALRAAVRGTRRTPRPAPVAAREADDFGAARSLAAACALCAPCDLATADGLRRAFARSLPFIALQRIASHPEVTRDPTGWTFAPHLRDDLVRSLPEARQIPPRRRDQVVTIDRVLAWQRERLDAITAPSGSRAALVLERERCLVDLRRRSLGEAEGPDVDALARRLEPHAAHPSLAPRLAERSRALGLSGAAPPPDPLAAARVARVLGAPAAPSPVTSSMRWRFALEALCAAACVGGAAWAAWAGW